MYIYICIHICTYVYWRYTVHARSLISSVGIAAWHVLRALQRSAGRTSRFDRLGFGSLTALETMVSGRKGR